MGQSLGCVSAFVCMLCMYEAVITMIKKLRIIRDERARSTGVKAHDSCG